MKNGLWGYCGAPLFGALALAVASASSSAETQTPPAPPPSSASTPAKPTVTEPPPAVPTDESLKPADIAARPALVLHSSANWEDGYAKIREALEKLRASAQKAGLKPVDHAMAAFTETDDAGFKFDALLPVEAPSGAKPELINGAVLAATPAGKAIKFAHTGSYDDIDTTYDAITAYLDEKGLEATNIYLEDYRVEGKDASDQALKVDIYVFIK
ncbi:effector-binding domain-containing protein [Rhodoblastus acidophilus]|uniref:Effector-binding domain-containing protein n=1 Tax=Rhodoblastus acidophilus TaxID=1074 RepID=A0A212RM76_RHOAC|nr:GyrI-like domain-containing protein [Rhodoblastus acidophilus]PPQ39123.1 AraC family transcriptional regulator [Rhodoblastus acidophilus]RAI24169.1 AraC family transcriptional regulator [Rhodoblastus acidophilus]SNB73458.1 effector-binding domain-containing protein [Rhodoblastus acidophilus]